MILPGLEAIYWVAYSSSNKDGELAARCYGIAITAPVMAFPVAGVLESTMLRLPSSAAMILGWLATIVLLHLCLDARRASIVDAFAECGERFRDRIIWTVYTAIAAIVIVGLSKVAPWYSAALLALFAFSPVRWAFRPSKKREHPRS